MSETIQLSEQQQDIYDKYVSGKNIFITGPGGCGKTKIIQYILDDALQRGKKVQLCAMTGCAAVLLERNAKTVHAWSGIGMANGSVEEIAEKVNQIIANQEVMAKWRKNITFAASQLNWENEERQLKEVFAHYV